MAKKRKLGRGGARPTGRPSPASRPNGPGGGARLKGANAIVPKTTKSKAKAKDGQTTSADSPPTLPFAADDAILLIGDGDLSFAASLVDHHACAAVTATVLESADVLATKYPQAAAHAARIVDAGGRVVYGVDVRTMGMPGSALRAAGSPPADRILFNFPHVGGKSTDVNRQVRHNQELLVAFFRRALPLLAPGGAIIVTLFEGAPYTLWNIRDLARHAGLQVDRSFRFQAAAYPGYHHARTLGVVRRGGGRKEKEGGHEEGNEHEQGQDASDSDVPDVSTTAWRGEDRPARSYVFVRKDNGAQPAKRKRADDESSDDDD